MTHPLEDADGLIDDPRLVDYQIKRMPEHTEGWPCGGRVHCPACITAPAVPTRADEGEA